MASELRYWETHPVDDVASPVLELEEAALFRAIKNACAHHREHGPKATGRLDVTAPMPPHEWLRRFAPGEGDTSFGQWAADKPAPYMLHLSHLHCFDPGVERAVTKFVTELARDVGFPEGGFWIDAYVGNYARTPFGVHLDGASNFTLGVVGTKELHLWEPEAYWAAQANGDLASLEGHGRVLEARPGRTIYWPSRYWHVAYPGEGLSVTFNVAAYFDRLGPRATEDARIRNQYFRRLGDPLALLDAFRDQLDEEEKRAVWEALEPVVLRRLLPRIAPALDARERSMLPLGELVGSIRARVGQLRQEQQRELAREVGDLLAQVSSLGLGPVAPADEIAFADDAVLRRLTPLTAFEVGEEIWLGARGRVLRLAKGPGVDRLVRVLAEGGAVRVADVLAGPAVVVVDGTPLSARALVERLVRLRALEPQIVQA